MRNPCAKDCPDRDSWCHSNCERYEAYNAENEARRLERLAQIPVNEMEIERSRRRAKVNEKIRKIGK